MSRSSPSQSAVKIRVARLALAIASIAFVMAAAELALRAAGFSFSYNNVFRSFHEWDEVVGMRGRPHLEGRFRTFEIDAWIANGPLGFRQPERQTPRSQATRSVFLLGDSFVWGWGVGQGEHLSDVLGARRPDWHVANLGVSATGPLQQLRLFERYGASQAAPGDLLVYVFFWNDFSDNVDGRDGSMLHARVDDGRVETVEPQPVRRGGLKSFLRRRSLLFNLALYQANRLSGERPKSASAPRFLPGAANGADVTAMRYALQGLKRVAAEHEMELVVAIVPAPTEIGHSPTHVDDVDNVTSLRRDLAGLLADLDIRAVDLLSRFRAARSARPDGLFYYEEDRHWTAAGHDLAAQVLASELAEPDPR